LKPLSNDLVLAPVACQIEGLIVSPAFKFTTNDIKAPHLVDVLTGAASNCFLNLVLLEHDIQASILRLFTLGYAEFVNA
jgi:hypothetical protein